MVAIGLIISWIVWFIIAILVFIINLSFVKYYTDNYESENRTTIVSTVCLTLAVITLLLIPVDVYNANVSDTVSAGSTAVRVMYYVLLSGQIAMLFVFVPFTYFYFEESGIQMDWKSRTCAASKYTVFLVILMIVLFVVGGILTGSELKFNNNEILKSIFDSTSRADTAILFVIGCVSLVGHLVWITYGAYGFSQLPVSFVKGPKPVLEEEEGIREDVAAVRSKKRTLQSNRLAGRSKHRKRDEESLSLLRRHERVLSNRSDRQGRVGQCVRKCGSAMRPFGVVLAIIFFLVSLLFVISFLLSTIDKLSASTQLYIIGAPLIFNPIDQLLIVTSHLYPLDVLFFVCSVLYIFVVVWSTVLRGGIRLIPWRRMYEVKPQRTAPQALLLSSVIIMLSVFALLFGPMSTLAPQYTHFGVQVTQNGTTVPGICNVDSPLSSQCSMTQLGVLSAALGLKFEFFTDVFYWFNWVFFVAWIVGLIGALCLKRKSYLSKYGSGVQTGGALGVDDEDSDVEGK